MQVEISSMGHKHENPLENRFINKTNTLHKLPWYIDGQIAYILNLVILF